MAWRIDESSDHFDDQHGHGGARSGSRDPPADVRPGPQGPVRSVPALDGHCRRLCHTAVLRRTHLEQCARLDVAALVYVGPGHARDLLDRSAAGRGDDAAGPIGLARAARRGADRRGDPPSLDLALRARRHALRPHSTFFSTGCIRTCRSTRSSSASRSRVTTRTRRSAGPGRRTSWRCGPRISERRLVESRCRACGRNCSRISSSMRSIPSARSPNRIRRWRGG